MSKTMKFLNVVLVLAMLIAGVSFAQPMVTRGGALKKRAYQTYSTTALFVDPTGSDANSCTASGTSACLTLAGALAKLPRFIRQNVTISIASGTYAESFTVENFVIQPGVTLAITGTMVSATLASGSTTGTVTAETVVSSASPNVITDSAQSWTVNDLRGKFITITSGALNGNSYPILSNTATTVTNAIAAVTAAGVGATYTIQQPGTVFTPSANSNIRNLTGGGTVTFSNIQVNRAWIVVATAAPIDVNATFTSCALVSSTSSGFSPGTAGANLTRTYVEGVGNAISMLGTVGRGLNYISLVARATTGVALNYTGVSTSTFLTLSTALLEGGSATTPILTNNTSVVPTLSSTYVTCTGGAGSVGIGTLPSTTQSPHFFGGTSNNGFTNITNCETAIRVYGQNSFSLSGITIVNATTGISISRGGQFDFRGSTPTFTTVTNQLQMDGENFTFSTLTSASPTTLRNAPYNSSFIF